MKAPLLEIAAFTPNSAIIAAENGADRIELCSGFAEGGISPSIGTISLVREMIPFPINILVRPRVGDFVYNKIELLSIEREINTCKQLGVNGIVVGVLTERGQVNVSAMKRIIEIASPLSVTFHRAFDQCRNPLEEIEKIIDCGAARILTSGCKPTVWEGIKLLEKLVKIANDRIIILPGGGINANNAKQIVDILGINEIHLSGKVKVDSAMSGLASDVSLCSPNELKDFSWYESDGERIREVKAQFGNHEIN